MKPLIKMLCFSVSLIFSLWSTSATAITAPVESDTYLDSSNTGKQQKNFGTTTPVIISLTNKALLSFKLSALPSTTTAQDVSKATLFFYVNSVSKTGKLQISPVNSLWQEQVVTYKTAPFQDAVIANSATVTQGQTYFAVDVTQLVKNWITTPTTNFGLAIEPDFSTPTTTISFDSKEATSTSHAAYLDVVLASTGVKGEKGDQGLPGKDGINGTDGAQGIQGEKGDKGDTGAIGPQDPQGGAPQISTSNCVDLNIATKAWTMCPNNTVMVGIHETGLATGSKNWYGYIRCCSFK